jgi:hypothetical protein
VAQEPLIVTSGPGPHDRREAGTRERLIGSRGFWITWTVLAAITLTLTLGAHRTATYPGDVRLARAIQSLDVPLIGGILHSENTIGNPWPAVTIIVAVTLVLLVIRHATLAVLFVGTNSLRAVGSVVKDLAIRPRPAVPLVRVTEHASMEPFERKLW